MASRAEGPPGAAGSGEPAHDTEAAAALLARLIDDSDFRARFQRDPAEACRAHGLPGLAEELAAAGSLRALDERESKSSLAGVVMAAAFEGVSAYQLLEQIGPSIGSGVGQVIDRALTMSHLEAIKGGLSGAPSGAGAAAVAPGADPAAAAQAPLAPAGAEAPGMEADIDAGGEGVPAAGADAAGDEAAAGADAGAGADAAGEGGGTPASAESLLENQNLILDERNIADLEGGVVDERLVAILDKLTEDHEIELSVIKTGHDQYTSSGSVSNHFHGRGLDISAVDGEPVNPGNVAAREVATKLAELPEQIRPTEVGTPFAISAPGFFTDGAHQAHLHVAFDDEMPEGLELPGGAADHDHADHDHGEAEADGGPSEAGYLAGRHHSVQFMAAVDPDAQGSGTPAPPPAEEVADSGPVEPGSGFDAEAAAADYPGDDAGQAALAQWLGRHAEAAGLPKELPVMAALVESNVANLNFGDADSVGFFQMRVGIWNQGEYAGYPENPELQLKWFIDTALAVKEQQGLSGDDPSSFGEWIADVERPAEQYRYRYAERLEEARGLLGASAGQPSAPAAAAAGEAASPPAEGARSAARDSAQFMAAALPGTEQEGAAPVEDAPAGGTAPAGGGAEEMVSWLREQVGTQEGSALQVEWASKLGLSADLPWCSIFLSNGLQELGMSLPDSPAYSGAWLDWEGGTTLDNYDDLQPGDFVIYDYGDGGITDHVAVYVGDDKVIGGNQSDMVSELPLNRGALVGVVRPDYK